MMEILLQAMNGLGMSVDRWYLRSVLLVIITYM